MVAFASMPAGSSPRVRGKRRPRWPVRRWRGLIPARAGKTSSSERPAARPRAHPRACGENNPLMKLFSTGEGSSPRVRGKRRLGRIQARPERLIPARAGKTPRTAGRGARGRAHPRACGENSLARPWNARENGSSPRVRGKPPGRQRRPGGEGLIPARAGKTPSGRRSPRDVPAHPRACGENAAVIWMVAGPLGSSPRVRGKRGRGREGRRLRGLIPARAGKTGDARVPGVVDGAHPRACGENTEVDINATTAAGSSPRVRGKRPSLRQPRHSARLIPARAGKTATACSDP